MTIFPHIEPYDHRLIDVDGIHSIYLEQSGNPKGIPIVFLHGGPGAGTSPLYRRYFNPEVYRIILFDQRGSGKSIPYGCVQNNTSDLLVDDIKILTQIINVNKFIIYGGSWGTTLALLYAQKYPETIYSLVLRGIFLCRKKDIHWFYQEGADQVFPDYWNKFIADIPNTERKNILRAFHKRVHSNDEIISRKFSEKWSEWEGNCSTLLPSKEVVSQFSDCAISLAKIETHFFINNCFINENQIIDNISSIKRIKCYIVHGRYDIVCTINQAYNLHEAYQNSSLTVINDAGHSLLEPGITNYILETFNNPNELIS